MLELAGIGCAVREAPEHVSQAADHTVGSVQNVLEKLA